VWGILECLGLHHPGGESLQAGESPLPPLKELHVPPTVESSYLGMDPGNQTLMGPHSLHPSWRAHLGYNFITSYCKPVQGTLGTEPARCSQMFPSLSMW
jgi:hypothetical protein